MVHAREVDGRTLHFGHSGWLWHNSYLLYDRETDSIWHHATGVAMAGPLRGKRLRRIPTTSLMSFEAWCAEHPDTLVLAKPPDPQRQFESDPYAPRNRTTTFGLALHLPGAPVFYPAASLPAVGAIEEDLAGTPLVVVRDARAGLALAFDRRVAGTVLSFDVLDADGPRPRLRERGGTREWSLRSGVPVPGTGAEQTLRPLPGTWFEETAWVLQNPAGSIRQAR